MTQVPLVQNLICWTTILGGNSVDDQMNVACAIRMRLLALSGRIVNRPGRATLRLPTGWPWATAFGALQPLITQLTSPACTTVGVTQS